MPQSLTFLFKRSFEFVNKDDLNTLPLKVRGLYVLYHSVQDTKKLMNVVYVGMVGGDRAGARGRIENHRRNKKDLWTHCSVFEVWDNILQVSNRRAGGAFPAYLQT